jgi:hypothetical protein
MSRKLCKRLDVVITSCHTTAGCDNGPSSWHSDVPHAQANNDAGGAEGGINSRIQAIRVAGRGYRNRKNFKTVIWFHPGGLQLYPTAP